MPASHGIAQNESQPAQSGDGRSVLSLLTTPEVGAFSAPSSNLYSEAPAIVPRDEGRKACVGESFGSTGSGIRPSTLP
jgi:hypothetical protein